MAYPTRSASSASFHSSDISLKTPKTVQIKLHFRKGLPLIRCRSTKDLPDPQGWTHNLEDDTFVVIQERIKQRVVSINGYTWQEGGRPYIQPTHTSSQRSFYRLDKENFKERLARAWRSELRRLAGDNKQVFVHLYVYLVANQEHSAPNQRAADPRLRTAHAVISGAKKQQQLPDLGRATVADYARARLPNMPRDEENPQLPQANTFRQMQHLDAQAHALHEEQQTDATSPMDECRTMVFVIDGKEVPLRFKVNVLRQALGLPALI